MFLKSRLVGARRVTLLQLLPGESYTLKLDVDSDQPVSAHMRNTATSGGNLTAQGGLVAAGDFETSFNGYTPGLFPLDGSQVAPGGYSVFASPISPRVMRFSQAADANGPAVIEVLE